MVETIKVFISSPSDVEYERKRAKEIVENLKIEFREDVVFDVYLYEEHHQTANRGDFQKQINRYLKEADIAIFIVWSRLGSKMSSYVGPVSGKKGVTGTEYEFEMALDLWQKTGKPDILVYRKTKEVALPPQYDSHEHRQKKKALEEVNAFFKTWFKNENNSIERAYFEFEDDDALKAYLHRHIASIVREKKYADSKVTHPYKGLDSFDFEDRVVFFGRDDDVRIFFERWRKEKASFVTVFGTSGCGKSSFVKAGLLPRMLKEAHGRFVVMRPSEASQNPFETLGKKLFDIYARQFEALSYSAEELQKRLESSDILPLRQVFKSDKIYLIFDQFEEIVNLSDALQERFFKFLQRCTEELDITILASIRTDSLDLLDEKPFFRAIKRFDYRLTFPSAANTIQIIKKPAELAHLEFDIDPETGKSLDKIIAEEAMKDANALPLVEFTLTQLEKQKRFRNGTYRLTIDAYRKIGELQGAIGTLAQQTFARLNEKEKRIFERLLPNLVTIKENQLILTDYLPPQEEKPIVALFVEARLFVQKGEYIRVAHEAFFRYWDFAKKVIEETKSDMIQRERIAEAYRLYEEQKSDKTALLQGSLLFIAEEILKRRGKEFFDNNIEGISGYIGKSIKHRKIQKYRLVFILLVTMLMLFSLTIYSHYQKNIAQTNLEKAEEEKNKAIIAQKIAEKNKEIAQAEKQKAIEAKKEAEKHKKIFKNYTNLIMGSLPAHNIDTNTSLDILKGALYASIFGKDSVNYYILEDFIDYSKAIEEKEKWKGLIRIANNSQLERLINILLKERLKLAEIDIRYAKKRKEIRRKFLIRNNKIVKSLKIDKELITKAIEKEFPLRDSEVYFQKNLYKEALENQLLLILDAIASGEKKLQISRLGSLSYYALFAKDYDLAITAAKYALKLDPSQIWIYTNLAHAYLYKGNFNQAKKIYLKYRGTKLDTKYTWEKFVSDDFNELTKRGFYHPDFEKIKTLLQSNNPSSSLQH